VDSVRSTAGSKIGKYHCRIPGKEAYPQVRHGAPAAPPAGCEPALPPPEAGKTPIMPICGVSPFRFAWPRSHELLWYPAVHCTNPCTTSAAGHVPRTESALHGTTQAVGELRRWVEINLASCDPVSEAV
jgi:hypothetical protein